jgi:hypothetical protein
LCSLQESWTALEQLPDLLSSYKGQQADLLYVSAGAWDAMAVDQKMVAMDKEVAHGQSKLMQLLFEQCLLGKGGQVGTQTFS